MQPKELSLVHLIRPSKVVDQNTPLLIMLHGYGSNEEDLFSFSAELPDDIFIISARAPYPLEPFGHAWYAIHFDNTNGKWSDDDQAIASREKIVAFIDEACHEYGLNTNNITLLGFSQGTILSYAVALSYPEKIRNVIGLSGYINVDILAEDYPEKNHADLKVYASHGQVDQVIPPEWAQRIPDFLDQFGHRAYL